MAAIHVDGPRRNRNDENSGCMAGIDGWMDGWMDGSTKQQKATKMSMDGLANDRPHKGRKRRTTLMDGCDGCVDGPRKQKNEKESDGCMG